MTPNWQDLEPHRSLDPGDSRYVEPPSRDGEMLASLIRAGRKTLLIGGPTGIGKSTVLAHAKDLLQQDHHVAFCPIDRHLNMRRCTVDQVMWRILVTFMESWPDARLDELSQNFRSRLHSATAYAHRVPTLAHEPEPPLSVPRLAGMVRDRSYPELLRLALNECSTLLGAKPIVLLIDGLEKLPNNTMGQLALESLSNIPEQIRVALPVPWHMAFDPDAAEIVRPDQKLFTVAPMHDAAAREPFLWTMLVRRLIPTSPRQSIADAHQLKTALGLAAADPFVKVARRAGTLSGGVPRTFLQLMADAATYARIRRDADFPDPSDLTISQGEFRDSLERALQQGDVGWLAKADGKPHMLLPDDVKVRLLAHGALLEDRSSTRSVLRVHPLLRGLIS